MIPARRTPTKKMCLLTMVHLFSKLQFIAQEACLCYESGDVLIMFLKILDSLESKFTNKFPTVSQTFTKLCFCVIGDVLKSDYMQFNIQKLGL